MKPQRTGRRLFDDASHQIDRFGLLLAISIAAVVALSLVDLRGPGNRLSDETGTIIVSVFVSATLLLTLRASGVARRYRLIADILVGIGLTFTILLILVDRLVDTGSAALGRSSPSALWIVLSFIAPVAVVRRLLQHRRPTASTLLGAVTAYLLIAIAFDFSFLAVDALGASPFFGTEEPTTSFMYFSLTTITTLGYGDLTPVSPLGRLLSTTLAVVGQVYLVTFVAMIVGLMVGQREKERSAE